MCPINSFIEYSLFVKQFLTSNNLIQVCLKEVTNLEYECIK